MLFDKNKKKGIIHLNSTHMSAGVVLKAKSTTVRTANAFGTCKPMPTEDERDDELEADARPSVGARRCSGSGNVDGGRQRRRDDETRRAMRVRAGRRMLHDDGRTARRCAAYARGHSAHRTPHRAGAIRTPHLLSTHTRRRYVRAFVDIQMNTKRT